MLGIVRFRTRVILVGWGWVRFVEVLVGMGVFKWERR